MYRSSILIVFQGSSFKFRDEYGAECYALRKNPATCFSYPLVIFYLQNYFFCLLIKKIKTA